MTDSLLSGTPAPQPAEPVVRNPGTIAAKPLAGRLERMSPAADAPLNLTDAERALLHEAAAKRGNPLADAWQSIHTARRAGNQPGNQAPAADQHQAPAADADRQ